MSARPASYLYCATKGSFRMSGCVVPLWTRGGARRGHAAATRDMHGAGVLAGRMPRTTDKHSTAPCVVWYGARAVLPVVPLVLLPLRPMDQTMGRYQGARWADRWPHETPRLLWPSSPAHLLHPRQNAGACRVHTLGRAGAGRRQHRREAGGALPRQGRRGRLVVVARRRLRPVHPRPPLDYIQVELQNALLAEHQLGARRQRVLQG